ncbi:MAG TPA: pyruvate, phosphate dikinase [Chloroflexi bacterium]|jgi:pyruvate,orthophosphate dikinase|nr:pyruvate, phosphate dikinase [Chloroflexota bacterium]
MATKWVYLFDEGNRDMRELLGGKGAGLAEMTKAGLPVPPGFTVTTEACLAYYSAGHTFPEGMWDQVLSAMKETEKKTGKGFGDPKNPLLVSVRSGARVSMPGMMDTVLNVGLNPETVQGLAELSGNERFAYDSYRRLISMFGRVVKDVPGELFDEVFDAYRARTEGGGDTDLTVDMLKEIVAEYKAIYKRELGQDFPDDVYQQLSEAIEAVFMSWFGNKAVTYRRLNKLPDDWGTAVNVCTMVFGNMGEESGTGVAFTRDPSTGEKHLFGEYLANAQGEDVVAGTRTPLHIEELQRANPTIYSQFLEVAQGLERHYRDMQDMEFTVERGKLWMLQTRSGKRTARAAIKIAVDMVNEGLITKEEAVQRIEPSQVDAMLHPSFDQKAKDEAISRGDLLATGLNASPGAATGVAVFDSERAMQRAQAGEDVVLVRPETSPDDVGGMLTSRGVLTQHGGATSHAAVVARGNNLPCVAGAEDISVDTERRQFSVDGRVVKEGDLISIDGTTGEVFVGAIPTIDVDFAREQNLATLLSWADEIRRLGIYTNADYPRDAKRARELGAEGIGLCRTEHMFFEEERRPAVVGMIMARTDEERQKYLDELLPLQRADFEGIFEAMDGLPVTIRLIDPPMHEFLPDREELIEEVTRLRCTGENPELLADRERMLRVVEAHWETNPMMGLRGCRVGLMMPGVTEMQTRAIFEAACRQAKKGVDVHVEVMIPLVSHVNELRIEREALERVAKEVMAEEGIEVDYKFGTMIETPRGAITAGELAKHAEFFSFGTNDLTQMSFGFSRDDAEGKFLLDYVERGILPQNPFQSLDQTGVGKLVAMAVKDGRETRPDIELGICGEHGGDPDSIHFFHKVGLAYVSCSPFRVPVARLAAAQAAIEEKQGATFRDK